MCTVCYRDTMDIDFYNDMWRNDVIRTHFPHHWIFQGGEGGRGGERGGEASTSMNKLRVKTVVCDLGRRYVNVT